MGDGVLMVACGLPKQRHHIGGLIQAGLLREEVYTRTDRRMPITVKGRRPYVVAVVPSLMCPRH